MNRRDSVLALLAVGGAIASRAAVAQQAGRVHRIGYLSAPTRESVKHVLAAFVKALHDLGWVEGENLVIEYRWADGKVERLPGLAADLVRRKVDLIVAPATSAALAARDATSSIPIVMIFANDPVAQGLVSSLRNPGGNITGTTFTAGAEIFGKQLQILKEAVPSASRVAVLSNPMDPNVVQMKEVESAARSLGIGLQRFEARGPEEFERAFDAMARERVEALLVGGTSTLMPHRLRLAELAMKARLTMCNFREMVEAGCLMAYGINMSAFMRAPRCTWTRSSRAPSRPTFPSSNRPNSSWRSTLRPPRHWDSPFRNR